MKDDSSIVATNWRLVRVSFRKQVSDGNYGTEAAEVTLEDYVNPKVDGEADIESADAMLDDARDIVHRQLLRSPSQRVVAAIPGAPRQPVEPYIRQPEDDDDMPLDWQRPGA